MADAPATAHVSACWAALTGERDGPLDGLERSISVMSAGDLALSLDTRGSTGARHRFGDLDVLHALCLKSSRRCCRSCMR